MAPGSVEMETDADLFAIFSLAMENVYGVDSIDGQLHTVFDFVLACWSREGRHYHDLYHLIFALEALLRLKHEGEDFNYDLAVLALFGHDLVNPRAPRAEYHSGMLMSALIHSIVPDEDGVGIKDKGLAVFHSIIDTQKHLVHKHSKGIPAVIDADLAIFAAPEHTYDAYVANVYREYSDVGNDAFKAGRVDVLKKFLQRESIYLTETGKKLWEDSAHANISREIRSYRD